MAYGEIDSMSKDIMNMKIGNIPPNSEVTIDIELLQVMSVELNTFYKLKILSTLTPRYVNSEC